jgi:2-oxoglutarate ferredoxin oxidoreductase subunit beta
VLSATYKALATLQLPPHETVIVSGIGCSSRMPYFLRTYGFHGVHGRSLPIAQGVKLAAPHLTVLAVGGDGDLFSIGAGHIPHAAARNIDITVINMDNSIYGLTKGQTSPTSPSGHKTKSTPYGALVQPMNPVLMALSFGATFVARGYSAKPKLLTDLIVQAVRHKGFSFVHVVSPCTEFNNTFTYFDAHVADLPASHDNSNAAAAIALAVAEDKVNLGVFYQIEKPTFDEASHRLSQTKPIDVEEYFKRYQ